MTQRDPWVNMLRTTLAAFGAGVGGADTVLVLPVRRGDPRRIPRHRRRVSRAGSRATPSCCCWRSHTSAGCSTRRAGRGSSRTSPNSWPQQAWPHFQAIEAHGGFVEARDHVAGQIAEIARPPHRRHRASPDRDHRRQRIPEPGRTGSAAMIRNSSPETWRATRPGSKRCATAPMPTWNAPVHARRCCCCRWVRWPSTTSGPPSRRTCWPPAESRRSTREPSTPTVSPRPSRSAAGRRGGGDLRHRHPLRHRGGRQSSRPHAPPAFEQVCLAGPEKAVADVPTPNTGPTSFLTAKIDAVEALSTLLTRLGA